RWGITGEALTPPPLQGFDFGRGLERAGVPYFHRPPGTGLTIPTGYSGSLSLTGPLGSRMNASHGFVVVYVPPEPPNLFGQYTSGLAAFCWYQTGAAAAASADAAAAVRDPLVLEPEEDIEIEEFEVSLEDFCVETWGTKEGQVGRASVAASLDFSSPDDPDFSPVTVPSAVYLEVVGRSTGETVSSQAPRIRLHQHNGPPLVL